MILITGGSGFIGGHFHRAIPNNTIIDFDLLPPSFHAFSEYFNGDIRKISDLEKATDGKDIDLILSLAAKHHDFGIGHDEYFDTNEDGTRMICKVATFRNIKKIIFFSSVAVYGIREEISTEDLSPRPDSPYGKSKLAGEKVLMEWASIDEKRSVIIIRPTVVYGANNKANMYNLMKQIDSGLYFHLGAADNIKSIAYVENLVQATLYLMNNIKPGVSVYNYADEPQLSARIIGETIATHLGTRIRLTVPKKLGLLVGLPFDLLIKFTGRNIPISSARIKKLGTQTFHSANKIFSEGFKPKYSTTEGIKRMADWYKAVK